MLTAQGSILMPLSLHKSCKIGFVGGSETDEKAEEEEESECHDK
jgi:hypothetical protein